MQHGDYIYGPSAIRQCGKKQHVLFLNLSFPRYEGMRHHIVMDMRYHGSIVETYLERKPDLKIQRVECITCRAFLHITSG
jgi:hypothetical protein